jgi:hypothetical protein
MRNRLITVQNVKSTRNEYKGTGGTNESYRVGCASGLR